MEKPFKYIDQPMREVPADLKAKVMNDVAVAKLIIDLANLFSLNMTSVVEQTIKKRKN